MGEERFDRADAVFRELSRPNAVKEDSDGLHRRPAQAGASSDSEARHEAQVPPNQTVLPIRPESSCRPDPEAGRPEETASVGNPIVPSEGNDQVQADHQGQQRPADADRASATRGGASRRKKWVVRVHAIKPDKYPQFMRDPDNPYAGMTPEERIEEIISFCGRLWARTCEDIARRRQMCDRKTKLEARARAA